MSNLTEDIRIVPDGTILLHEGQPSEGAFVILKGQVNITRKANDKSDILLAQLDEGQVFGEMSLVDNAPCSATVTAAGELKVRVLDGKLFSNILHQDNQVFQPVIESLFQRMRAMNKRVVDLESQLSSTSSNTPSSSAVVIKGLTEPAKHALYDMNSLVVDEFPYKIGRWSKSKSKRSWFSFGDARNHVEIHDIPPYVVSRHHCQLEKNKGNIYLVDTTSRLGTWVNGRKISAQTEKKVCLQPGPNTVHIGDKDSQFAFEVVIP